MTTGILVMIDRPTLGQSSPAGGEPFRVVPAGEPALRATTLAATRGDGIFETAAIRDGAVQAAAAHLARFARSAAMLDMPAPDPDVYTRAIEHGISLLPDASDAAVKYVLTRGDEEDPALGPIGWAHLHPSEDFTTVRRDGVRVALLSRGYALDVTQTSPWLLQGAKTLSYAVNRAALREAARRGADDVVFTTTDGYVLEGPTSSLVARFGDTLVTTPAEAGVLPGTTQQGMFAYAESVGLASRTREIRLDELATADALWLTSSVRLAVPVNAVDGVARRVDEAFTAAVNDYLAGRRD